MTIYNRPYIVDSRGINATHGQADRTRPGTLDLLVLRTIEHEPRHGWAIAKRIQQVSNEVLRVQRGSLYPALYRLEKDGLIAGRWAATDTGREAKFYSLTRAGRAQLEREAASWAQLSAAIDLVLREA